MQNYESVQELFRNMPNRVLLVGNGLIEDKAKVIDEHPFVVRFNGFQIDGYENHVGTKIDAISVHCSDLTLSHCVDLRPIYSKYKEKVPIFTTSPRHKHSKSDILHLETGTTLFNVDSFYTLGDRGRLSSGVSMILNLVIFYGKEVDLIGFDFMKTGHYYNSEHNIEFKESEKKNSPHHNVEYEESLIKRIKGVNFL